VEEINWPEDVLLSEKLWGPLGQIKVRKKNSGGTKVRERVQGVEGRGRRSASVAHGGKGREKT